MNRVKGLNLVDRVTEELWTEVCNIVQEAVTKTIPKKNKCKKAKRLPEKDLHIAEERREAKGNRERRSQPKQSLELTVAQIMSSLLYNSDLN